MFLSSFLPFFLLLQKDTLWFFNDQLCRSIPMVYQRSVVASDLPGYRFTPREDVFMSPRSHPENDCFCVDQELCDMLGDGMFPISACQFDAPIVLSWPHFLGANASFADSVEGLDPSQEEHGFWFDVQPVTGTTLSAKARLQVNLAIKHSENFDVLKNIQDTVLPILWFEEGLDELGPEIVDTIRGAITGPPKYKAYILCVLLGLAIAALIISLVACIQLLLRDRVSGDKFSTPSSAYGDSPTETRLASPPKQAEQEKAPSLAACFVPAETKPLSESGRSDSVAYNMDGSAEDILEAGSPGLSGLMEAIVGHHHHHEEEKSVNNFGDTLNRAVKQVMLRLDANGLASDSAAGDSDEGGGSARRSRAEDDAEERRPMLLAAAEEEDGSTTADSSRSTTASHSRNTSTGSNDAFSSGKDNGAAVAATVAVLVEDAEQLQLLSPPNGGDQRKSKISTHSA